MLPCRHRTLHAPTGQTYRTVRRSFPTATVIGWTAGGTDAPLNLNCADSTIVAPGSQLIFVARGVDDLKALPEPYQVCVCNFVC